MMRPKSPRLLDDIRKASDFITQLTVGLSSDDYEQNELVRSAVERKFTIIGEALMRLQSDDPTTVARISQFQKIIGFRHRLAHGYNEEIDNAEVWRIVHTSLPVLQAEVIALLAQAN